MLHLVGNSLVHVIYPRVSGQSYRTIPLTLSFGVLLLLYVQITPLVYNRSTWHHCVGKLFL